MESKRLEWKGLEWKGLEWEGPRVRGPFRPVPRSGPARATFTGDSGYWSRIRVGGFGALSPVKVAHEIP
jgi:hypothetical protein